MALRSPPQMRKKKRNPAKYLIMKASICNCMELLSYQRTEHLKCIVGCDSDIWALLHERSSPPMCCSSVCFGGLLMRDLFTSAKNWAPRMCGSLECFGSVIHESLHVQLLSSFKLYNLSFLGWMDLGSGVAPNFEAVKWRAYLQMVKHI